MYKRQDEYVDIPIDDTGLMQIFEANDSDLKKVQLLKKGFQDVYKRQVYRLGIGI